MLPRSTLADEATSVLVLEPTSERPVAEIIARLAHAYALREEFASSVVRIFSNRRNKCRIIVLYLKDEVWRAPFKSHGNYSGTGMAQSIVDFLLSHAQKPNTTGTTKRNDVARSAALLLEKDLTLVFQFRFEMSTEESVPESKAIVFVVDDDVSMREALESLIRSAGFKVETFASAQDFLARRRADVPACLVLDVQLPGLSGLDLQKRIIEANREIPIVFITGHGDVPTSVRAMKAGAVEFLIKPFSDRDLLDAIQQAIKRDQSARQQQAEMQDLRGRYESLTLRERQVMEKVASGLLNKQAAAELGTSEITIKVHRGHIMQKMGARSLADLVRAAEKLGIFSRTS